MWHERLVLRKASDARYVILTPQLDMYMEALTSPPRADIRQLGDDRQLPPDIQERQEPP